MNQPAPLAATPPEVKAIPIKPGIVAVTNPDGTVEGRREGDLAEAMAQGARPATEAEFMAAKTGTAGKIASFGVGVGRGATFGLSDAAFVEGTRALAGDAQAEDMRRSLRLANEANPRASMAGEIVGSLAPLAFGAPPGEASITAESMLARAGQRALAAMPRAALEGAAIGAGHQLTEDVLGDHDVTAQKLLASGAKGAVFGAILGGGMSAGLGAVGDRFSHLAGGGGPSYKALSAGSTAATAGAEDAAGVAAGRAAPGKTLGFLTDAAEEQAFKATGAKMRDIQKLGATAEQQTERMQRIGRKLLDEDIVTATASQEKIARRLGERLKEVGGELDDLRSGLDKSVIRPEMSRIGDRFRTEVLEKLADTPMSGVGRDAAGKLIVDPGGEASYAVKFFDEMATKGGERPDFATLYKYRRRMDDILDPKKYQKLPGTAPPGVEHLSSLRKIVEDEFETAGEKAANDLGDTFLGKYRLAKETYADFRTAEKILAKEVARGGGNQTISLTDVISTVGGMAAAGPGGIAMGAANYVRRNFGNQIAAHALDKATQLRLVQRAAEGVDVAISRGVKGFLTGTPSSTPRKTTPQLTPATISQLRQAIGNKQALTANVANMVGGAGLSAAAPKTSLALATTIQRAASYIETKLGKEPPPAAGLSFTRPNPRGRSVAEQFRTQQAIEAIDDPVALIEQDLPRMSREHVDAIKAVYPGLYQMVRKELMKQGDELRPKLSIQQEMALSVMWKVPVSRQLEPKISQSFATAFEDAPADPTTGGGPPEGRPFQRSGTYAAGTDHMEKQT